MKNAVLYLNILFCATFMLACEQDVEVFHASGEDRLNFYYEENAEADSLIDYTFIYLPSEQMLDTIWFDVETSGYVTDYPRTISFEQMAVDSNAAIPDVHYVAFDNPELQNVYVVPAHSTRVRVPLVVKKDDPELEKKQFILRFCIKENKLISQHRHLLIQSRCLFYAQMPMTELCQNQSNSQIRNERINFADI